MICRPHISRSTSRRWCATIVPVQESLISARTGEKSAAIVQGRAGVRKAAAVRAVVPAPLARDTTDDTGIP